MFSFPPDAGWLPVGSYSLYVATDFTLHRQTVRTCQSVRRRIIDIPTPDRRRHTDEGGTEN